jgi:hypothetical protein
LTKPHKIPARIANTIPTGKGSPKLVRQTPAITELKVITVPTDKSIPPLTIMKVMPSARIPLTAVISRIVTKLADVKKFGEAIVKIIKRRIRLEKASSV